MKHKIISKFVSVVFTACLATGMVAGSLPAAGLEVKAAVNAQEAVNNGLVIRESQINQLLTKDLELPSEVTGMPGAVIEYSVKTTDAKYVSVEGNKLKVTRPEAGQPDYKFTLTATVTPPTGVEVDSSDGKLKKEFPLIIRAGLSGDSYAGYVYVCFSDKNVSGYVDVQQIHFFLSEDGLNWTALNGCNPIFQTGTDYINLIEGYGGNSVNYKVASVADINTTKTGDASVLFPFEGEDQGIRDPYLIRGCRKEDSNKVWILATDLNTMAGKYGGNKADNRVGIWELMTTDSYGSTNLFIYETEDWVNWTRRYIDVDKIGGKSVGACMAWAPEAIYNPVKDNYLVYWSARTTVDGRARDRLYCNETKDFVTFGPAKLCEQEPFYQNYLPNGVNVADDGYGNIDTSQLWVAETKEDGTVNPYGTLYRLVKDETDNHIELKSAKTVLASKYEGNENQAVYDAADATRITPYTDTTGKIFSTMADVTALSDPRNIKKAEVVYNWFKNESVADHFTYIPQKGIEQYKGTYEGATLFKFIDRDEWCVMIDNYGNMSIRYEPYLTTDLSKPDSIHKADVGTYGRTGGDVGTHGGMIPITVDEYNTLIDTYNADSSVSNYHKIDYISIDTSKFDAKRQELKAAAVTNEYTDSIKKQMTELANKKVVCKNPDEVNALILHADKLLKNKKPAVPKMQAGKVTLEQKTVTICTKSTDGLKKTVTLKAEADVDSETSKITFTSNKPTIAAVDAKTGVVTAKKAGTAKITAVAPGGAKAVCTVTVKGVPSKITLNKKSIKLKVKKTFQIKVSIPKGTVCSEYKYKSNKPKIVSVSKKGKITARKKGIAKITVTAANNSKAKAVITVKVN